jgi:hypothetical protein
MKMWRIGILSIGLMGWMAPQIHAQTSDECKKQYTILQDNVKDKSYQYAMPAMKFLLDSCLTVSTGLYIYGEQMYWAMLGDSTMAERKQGLLDSLDLLYNRRLLAAEQDPRFGTPALIEGRRLRSYAKFRTKEYEVVHKQAEKAVRLGGENAEAEVMYLYMQFTAILRKLNKLGCEEVIEVYNELADNIELNLEKYEDKDSLRYANYMLAQEKVDKLAGPCLTCESLVEIFKRDYEAKKADPNWIKKAAAALDKKKCMKLDEFKSDAVLIALFDQNVKLNPTAQGYWLLARLHLNAGNCDASLGAFQKAFEMEEAQSPKKMVYGKALALQTYACGDASGARRVARRLLEIKPDFGWAYMFIGDLYASSAKQCAGDDPCTAGAALWAAADKYNQARNTDPSLENEARRRINSVAARFPLQSDCFFKDLKDGSPVNVGCWIGESTTVRTRQ